MGKAFRLGIFIFGTLTVLAVGVFLIGKSQLMFTPTYRLTADFQTVGGLDNGADVRLGGIHVGTVKQIHLPNQTGGKVTVVIKMDELTRNIVRKDATATIKTEGLLGDKYVEITYGTEKAALVRDGDVIKGETPVDMSDLAMAATHQATAAAESLKDDMEALKQNFLLRGFFKDRGYTDQSELTKYRIPRLPATHPSKEFTFETSDLFEKQDNAKLKNHKPLDEAGNFLQENKFGLAVIASAETVGDTAKVKTLTEARANVVREYLVGHFRFDDTHLKTIGLGKRNQAGETSRIQILVYNTNKTASSSQNQAPANQ